MKCDEMCLIGFLLLVLPLVFLAEKPSSDLWLMKDESPDIFIHIAMPISKQREPTQNSRPERSRPP
jgi:hypothetical protein